MENQILMGPGDTLMKEGDEAKTIFYLKSGTLNIFVNKEKIATTSAGEFIGEMAFIDGKPRSATVIAASDCELVEISQTVFQKELDALAPWLQQFIKTLIRRSRASNQR